MLEYINLRELEKIIKILYDLPIDRRKGVNYQFDNNRTIVRVLAEAILDFCINNEYEVTEGMLKRCYGSIPMLQDTIRIANRIMKGEY